MLGVFDVIVEVVDGVIVVTVDNVDLSMELGKLIELALYFLIDDLD